MAFPMFPNEMPANGANGKATRKPPIPGRLPGQKIPMPGPSGPRQKIPSFPTPQPKPMPKRGPGYPKKRVPGSPMPRPKRPPQAGSIMSPMRDVSNPRGRINL